ncbi:hypothetical protein [Streptomyces iconiensis]|uniref:Transcriptional regulator n=1 Tax=Streptomyces iconiensis TaxID=1384038 RepID=A0ABT7A0F5_9ACTN|nr:hypothetical protein [Streptomyces iconiensis]MDJ1134811.1 hypothetical protein [Streptomyces iconiensis]
MDALARLYRTFRADESRHMSSPESVSALLELIAEVLEEEPEYPVPHRFHKALQQVSGRQDGHDYLRTVAALLLLQGETGTVPFARLPMAPWEVDIHFPRARSFGACWIESDEVGLSMGITEAIQKGVTDSHPGGCTEDLSGLTAELQRLTTLFASPEQFKASLEPRLDWATPGLLRDILRAANLHLEKCHQG